MPITIGSPRGETGVDSLYNTEEKIFEDIRANPGEKAFVFIHSVPFEGSVSLVNLLTSTRLVRKGFDVSIILYGPGVLLASRHRGYPTIGTEGFPGNLAGNRQIETLLKEGATVYACRFAMGALYGFREEDLIDGVKAFSPLDVLDSALTAWRAGAFQLNTWTVLRRLWLAGVGAGDRPRRATNSVVARFGRLALPGRGGRLRAGGRRAAGFRWHRHRPDADRVPAGRAGLVLCARAQLGGREARHQPAGSRRHRDRDLRRSQVQAAAAQRFVRRPGRAGGAAARARAAGVLRVQHDRAVPADRGRPRLGGQAVV
jgi:uncharacterized repeat protein (TIGR04044 family)